MPRDQQSWRSSFSLIQTYSLFPDFNLWNYLFVVGFYVLDLSFACLLISLIFFHKFVFKNYSSFCSAEFALLLLLSEFSKTALFVMYSSRSMFTQSQLRNFLSVILSKYINCLYTLGIRFFVWKVIYHGSLIFIKISRISFTIYS